MAPQPVTPIQPRLHPNRLPKSTVFVGVDWKTENSYPVRWTKHSTFSSSLPSTSANAFVANAVVGMLCFGQRLEPLEQEER